MGAEHPYQQLGAKRYLGDSAIDGKNEGRLAALGNQNGLNDEGL